MVKYYVEVELTEEVDSAALLNEIQHASESIDSEIFNEGFEVLEVHKAQ